MDVLITVVEITGTCPVYKVGDSMLIQGAQLALAQTDAVCIHAFPTLAHFALALRSGADPVQLGLTQEGGIAHVQCPDPGPPLTPGGTVTFELRRIEHEVPVASDQPEEKKPVIEEQTHILQLLSENERALQQLYETYAGKFPDFNWLWGKLAEEEHKHARWLQALLPKVQEGTIFLGKRRFNAKVIQASLTYIHTERAKAKDNEVSILNALSTAFSLEKSLIESKFLDSFGTDDPTLKHVLDNLTKSTKTHQRLIEKAWTRYKALQQETHKPEEDDMDSD